MWETAVGNKTIGIFANGKKDREFKYTKILADCIRNHGGDIRICPFVAEKAGIEITDANKGDIYTKSDMLICLGGDGTFLKAARKAYLFDLPILGINLGSLGFLTEVDRDDIDKAVRALMDAQYEIEERMMLKAVIRRKDGCIFEDTALNDVVISRGAISKIINLRTYINDNFIDTFPGDGLIVSSPTGSTAYSLSAGGPIVEPNIGLMIISPICPHILYSRSIITPEDSAVRIIIEGNSDCGDMITIDGQKGYSAGSGDVVEVTRSVHTVKMICITRRNFFSVLRTKIYERGERIKENEV